MICINGEIHSSKNSRQVVRDGSGRVRVIKSAQSKADEQSFAVQLAAQRGEWERMLPSTPNDVLCVVFRFRRATARRFDYLNMAQGICDAMVNTGYLVDDSANYFLPVFVPYRIERDNPGVDIWIEQQD